MKRMHAIRLIVLAPLAFAAALSAGEAAKTPASNMPANTPGQSGTPSGQPGTMGTGPGAAAPGAGGGAMGAANGSGAATVTSDKIAFARPTASIEIMAEPSKVWKKLTSHEGLAAFGVAGDKKRNLEATRKAMSESLARFKGLMEKTSAAGNP